MEMDILFTLVSLLLRILPPTHLYLYVDFGFLFDIDESSSFRCSILIEYLLDSYVLE